MKTDEVCRRGIVRDRANTRADRGAIEKAVEGKDHDHGCCKYQKRVQTDAKAATDVDRLQFQRATGELAGIGPVGFEQAVLDHNCKAESDQNNAKQVGADQSLQ